MKKRVVVALGHRALGTTLPEQKEAVKKTAKVIGDLIEKGYQVAISTQCSPQVGMIHTAMNEFAKEHEDYTAAPMSVCSAMSQGYIGYDLQNAIREELMNRGIYRTVSTVLTQVIVDPYDEAFYTPTKVLGRYMDAEEASAERKKGNYVVEEPGKGFRRIVSAPNPVNIVEIDADQSITGCRSGCYSLRRRRYSGTGTGSSPERSKCRNRKRSDCRKDGRTDADELIILTSVEKVKHQHGQTGRGRAWRDQRRSGKRIHGRGHFGKYNMYPKFRAAVEFLEKREGRSALITSFDKFDEALKGKNRYSD